MRVNIKPLSVNQAWRGRRFKSDKYKAFEKNVLLLLPNKYNIPLGALKIRLKWGFSNKISDWDNPIKPFQDILQKKYNFNDSRIFDAHVTKELVPKGKEYIYFKIESYETI